MKELGSKYKKLDPEVRELVRALNQVGISTIGSSGGNVAEGKVPFPYVDIDIGDCDAGALEEFYQVLARMPTDKFPGYPLRWVLADSVQVRRAEDLITVGRLQPEYCNPQRSKRLLEMFRGGATILTGLLMVAREVAKIPF